MLSIYIEIWDYINVLLEDPRVDGRIILRWILRKWDAGAWIGSSWFRMGTGGGHF